MNVCAKCGTPMAGSVMSCPACGGLPVRTLPRGAAWQRVVTGVGGLALLVAGAWLDSRFDTPLGGILMLPGALLVPATFVPYGLFRRVLVAVGVGMLWAIGGAAAGGSMVDPGSECENCGTLLALLSIGGLAGFCLGAYAGYRLAR